MEKLWESAVRLLKLHLKRTVGEACLSVAEMITVLVQIEAMLNSRPLTPLSHDPNDLNILIPGHFLIGENLQSYPEADLSEVPENRLSRWQHVQQLKQQVLIQLAEGIFEYLSTEDQVEDQY